MTHRTVSSGKPEAALGPPPGLPADSRAGVMRPTVSCPVEITLAALRGRWTTLIVRELLRGPHTFSDLAAALPDLSAKVLTDRLRQLTDAGVLHRHRTVGWPSTVRYELTPWGRELGPVLQAMWEWGARAEQAAEGAQAGQVAEAGQEA